MINIKAATAASSKDEEHGIEITILRIQPGPEPGMADYQYKLYYPGGYIAMSFDVVSKTELIDGRSKTIENIMMDDFKIDRLLKIHEKINDESSKIEFLRSISKGIVNVFNLRYGVIVDKKYFVSANLDALVAADAEPSSTLGQIADRRFILAELDVPASTTDEGGN